MSNAPTRDQLAGTGSPAEGWSVSRVTPPSRLNGANGLRTGSDGRIYVAQVAGSAVSAIDPDSGAIETISPMGGAVIAPDDLAFDEAGNLYLTEITEGRVRMLAPDGTSRVIWGDSPVANPITFTNGRLISGECRVGGRIMELDRNGGAPRVILDNAPMPNAFEVGPDGKLYFPAMATNEIWRLDLDSGETEVVVGDLGLPDSVKFDSMGRIVSTQVASGQVLRIDPRTGEREVLADIGPGLDNVTFVGDRIFVSHITGSIHEIVAPGNARPLVEKGFQWPIGLAVAGDGTLYVSDGGFQYAVAQGGGPQLVGMLFTPGFPGWIRDLAVAGPGELVATTANGDIARWRPAAMEHEMIASGLDRAMGVALAADGSAITCEYGSGRVLSVRDGAITELAAGLDRPSGVSVDADGTIYVADTGAGRVVKVVGGRAETVLDGLGKPEGIAVFGGRLYVADTAAKQLVECNLPGGASRSVAAHLPIGAPPGSNPAPLGGVGDMCGPMITFCGVAAGGDGTIYVAGDLEGSVLAVRPA